MSWQNHQPLFRPMVLRIYECLEPGERFDENTMNDHYDERFVTLMRQAARHAHDQHLAPTNLSPEWSAEFVDNVGCEPLLFVFRGDCQLAQFDSFHAFFCKRFLDQTTVLLVFTEM